jgi:hypothetical protein
VPEQAVTGQSKVSLLFSSTLGICVFAQISVNTNTMMHDAAHWQIMLSSLAGQKLGLS